MRDSLETLAITHEITDDDSDLEWLLELLTNQKRSFKHFTNLKHLTIPQLFIFNAEPADWLEDCCQPRDLPPKLETLEILYPQTDIEDWVERFELPEYQYNRALAIQAKLPSALRRITLTCRDEVGSSASFFTEYVDAIWPKLSLSLQIQTYVFCQIQGTRYNLIDSYEEEHRIKDEETTDSAEETTDSGDYEEHSGPRVYPTTDSEEETTDSENYVEHSGL